MWDHYARLSSLLDPSVSQSSSLLPLHSYGWCPFTLREPLGASVTLWEATAPVKLPAWPCLPSSLWMGMRANIVQEWYFTAASPLPTGNGSAAPTYATHAPSRLQTRV